jgi:histidinol phosphatase-like enzyme (inositol monophosphatase family)
MNNWLKELDVAVAAARAAGELAARYQHGIQAETKSDLSPVTHADRECEQLIASMLTQAFPGDGLLGEEGARKESSTGRKWIVDPIDGTRDYVRGNPLWATLIGLEVDGEIAAGVASLPALGGMYTAAVGGGAFRNGEPIRVSAKSNIADSVLCFNGLNKINTFAFKDGLVDWMQNFWAVRSMGGAPDAMLIASGQADVWIEPTAAPWDLAPLKVILEEAGAVFFNFDGGRSIYAGNCIACAPGLVGEMQKFVGLGYEGPAYS